MKEKSTPSSSLFKWMMIGFYLMSCQVVNAQIQSKAFEKLLQVMVTDKVPKVECEQVKKMSNAVFLDARERKEFEVSHLKNAKWVGFDTFSMKNLPKISKETPIVVYCSIGVRSGKIAEKLLSAGYKNVYNFNGSIFEWVNQGNPVYDMSGNLTNKIHVYDSKWGVWCNKGEKIY
jgi:rhodanese-related sulfurtransferase